MLASVFRRLYFTNKFNFENLFIRAIERSNRIANIPTEEVKMPKIECILRSNKQDESKSPSEIEVDLNDDLRTHQLRDNNQK